MFYFKIFQPVVYKLNFHFKICQLLLFIIRLEGGKFYSKREITDQMTL